VVDIFRVVGGREHIKFMHSHFGQLTTRDLSLEAVHESIGGAQMRGFRLDGQPPSVWSVDWEIEDHLKYLPPGKQVRLRYTDLTPGAEVLTAEGWVAVGLYGGTAEAWIPRLLIRRRSDTTPLASTFVGVIEPYEQDPVVTGVGRLDLQTPQGMPASPSAVAVELHLADGRRDVLIAVDAEDPLGGGVDGGDCVVQVDSGIRLHGQLGFIRFDASGQPERVMMCLGKSLAVGELQISRTDAAGWIELDVREAKSVIESGAPDIQVEVSHGTE
jgi:hypothetical protein